MTEPKILGMGWVTPLGRDLQAVAEAVRAGVAPAPVLLPNPLDGREVPVLQVPEGMVQDAASWPRLRRSSAISHYAVAAAADAVKNARLAGPLSPRTALVFAVSDGGVIYSRRFFAELVERGMGAGSPLLFPETVYNAPASHIAANLGLSGEALTLVGDAAVGLSAMRTACELLDSGAADYCLVASAQELDWITCDVYGRWRFSEPLEPEGRRVLFSEGAAALLLGPGEGGVRVRAAHPGFSYATEAAAERLLGRVLSELTDLDLPSLVISSAEGTRLAGLEARALRSARAEAPAVAAGWSLGEAFACSTLQRVILGALFAPQGEGGSVLVPAVGFNGQLSGLVLTVEPGGRNR